MAKESVTSRRGSSEAGAEADIEEDAHENEAKSNSSSRTASGKRSVRIAEEHELIEPQGSTR